MIGKLVSDWLDPYFVREEELALRINAGRGWQRRVKLSPQYATFDLPGTMQIDFGMPQTDTVWIIDCIIYEYATSNDVATRFPAIYYPPRDDFGQIPYVIIPCFMTASLDYWITIAPGLHNYPISSPGVAQGGHFSLPMRVLEDTGIYITVGNGQAKDVHRAVMYYWERAK